MPTSLSPAPTPSPQRPRRPWQRSEIALFFIPLGVLGLLWGAQKYGEVRREKARLAASTVRRPPTLAALRLRMKQSLLYKGTLDVAFAPDGKTLVCGGPSGGGFIDISKSPWLDKSLVNVMGWAYAVAYSPDGKTVVCGGDYRNISFLSPTSGKTASTIPLADTVRSLSFSPDGKWLAVGAGVQGYWDPSISVWDIKTGKKRWSALSESNLNEEVQSVEYSPDGSTIAGARFVNQMSPTSKEYCLLTLWRASDGHSLMTLRGSLDEHQLNDDPWDGAKTTSSLAYSPDGKALAINWDGATVFDAKTGKVQYKLPHPITAVCAVDYSHNGRWLATGGATIRTNKQFSDYEIKVWDTRTHEEIRVLGFQAPFGDALRGQIKALRFSPDDKTLVACTSNKGNGGEIRNWDMSRLPKSSKGIVSEGKA